MGAPVVSLRKRASKTLRSSSLAQVVQREFGGALLDMLGHYHRQQRMAMEGLVAGHASRHATQCLHCAPGVGFCTASTSELIGAQPRAPQAVCSLIRMPPSTAACPLRRPTMAFQRSRAAVLRSHTHAPLLHS